MQNRLIYNTSSPYHKTTVCLGHQCLWVVPVWQPQAFINGYLLFDEAPAVFDFSPGNDIAIYDQMCALLLEPHVWANKCFEAHISTAFSLTEETFWDYACVYNYACSSSHEYLLQDGEGYYVGK